MEITVAGFLQNWGRVRSVTLATLAAWPPDKLDFSPVEPLRSARELFYHIAGVEGALVSGVTRDTWEFNGPAVDSLETPEALAEVLGGVHNATVQELMNHSMEALLQPVQAPFGFQGPGFALMSGAVEHEVHHRGQLYVYLRLLGVAPPPMFGQG